MSFYNELHEKRGWKEKEDRMDENANVIDVCCAERYNVKGCYLIFSTLSSWHLILFGMARLKTCEIKFGIQHPDSSLTSCIGKVLYRHSTNKATANWVYL